MKTQKLPVMGAFLIYGRTHAIGPPHSQIIDLFGFNLSALSQWPKLNSKSVVVGESIYFDRLEVFFGRHDTGMT